MKKKKVKAEGETYMGERGTYVTKEGGSQRGTRMSVSVETAKDETATGGSAQKILRISNASMNINIIFGTGKRGPDNATVGRSAISASTATLLHDLQKIPSFR